MATILVMMCVPAIVIAFFRRGLATILVTLFAGVFAFTWAQLASWSIPYARVEAFAEKQGMETDIAFAVFLMAGPTAFAFMAGGIAIMIADLRRDQNENEGS